MFYLDGTIARIERWLPSAVASEAVRRDIEVVARQLPAVLSNCFYLEAPLTGDALRADLIVRVTRAASVRLADDLAPPGSIGDDAMWRRVASLARCWQHPESVLASTGTALWLEFDVEPGIGSSNGAACTRRCFPPGVFLDFEPSAVNRASTDRRLEMLLEALTPLIEGHLGRSVDSLRLCLASLPMGAAPMSIGVLLPRDASTIRLCVLGLSDANLAAYLESIAWSGCLVSVDRMQRALAVPDGGGPIVSLVHLDVRGAVLPRVGIEYRFARRPQLRGVVQERAFFDRLVALGLCTIPKRDAVLCWPGIAVDVLPHELWPSVVGRRLNHVKIVHDGQRSSAKAYLRVVHVRRATPPSRKPTSRQ